MIVIHKSSGAKQINFPSFNVALKGDHLITKNGSAAFPKKLFKNPKVISYYLLGFKNSYKIYVFLSKFVWDIYYTSHIFRIQCSVCTTTIFYHWLWIMSVKMKDRTFSAINQSASIYYYVYNMYAIHEILFTRFCRFGNLHVISQAAIIEYLSYIV